MAKDIGKMTLLGVRASYLFVFDPYKGKDEKGVEKLSYKGSFLVPKADLKIMQGKIDGVKMPIMDALRMASREAQSKEWGDDETKWPKLKPEKKCWRDGDLEDRDGYEGCWFLSASSKVENKPLAIMNRKDKAGIWIPAQPGQIYSGCYVNATVRLWAQDNDYGKRLNAELKAVQFVRDGEAFGNNRPINPNEEFDDDDVSDAADLGDADEDDDDSMI